MSLLNVDTINENTAAAGVTVEGVLIKDSALKIPGGSPGADKVLTSDASGNAAWEAAATPAVDYVKISTHTASDTASLEITSGIDTTYASYYFLIDALVPVTDNTDLQVYITTNGGTSWTAESLTSGQWHMYTGSGGAGGGYDTAYDTIAGTHVVQAWGVINTAALGTYGWLTLIGAPNDTRTSWIGHTSWAQYAGYTNSSWVSGQNASTTAVNGIKFQYNTGNVSTGKIIMYGLK